MAGSRACLSMPRIMLRMCGCEVEGNGGLIAGVLGDA